MTQKVIMKDIAEYAGVSIRTVSLAIKGEGRISEKTRNKILKLANDLNYRPNIMAKGLVNQSTYLLGAIFPFVSESYYGNVLSAIEESCKKNFYDLLLNNSRNNPEFEKAAIERLLDRKVDGIISYPDYRCYEAYQKVIQENIPLVQINYPLPGINASSVTVDLEKGAFKAVSYLIELGHRNIGHIGYYGEHSIMKHRVDGYRKALFRHSLFIDLEKYEETSGISFEAGHTSMIRLLKRCPELTAVFAATDNTALGAISGCLEMGKKVPEDISIIGCTDMDYLKYIPQYQLTTVSLPKEEIGYAAFELFMKQKNKEKASSILLEPELIIRKTTRILK